MKLSRQLVALVAFALLATPLSELAGQERTPGNRPTTGAFPSQSAQEAGHEHDGEHEHSADPLKESESVIKEALQNPNAVLEVFLAEAPEEIREDGRKAKEKFESLRKELAVEVGEMRALLVRYANEEANSPEDAQQYRDQRNKVRRLMQETYEVAMEVFLYMPDQLAGQYMMTMIQHCEKHDIYNQAALEGATSLIDKGVRHVYVFKVAARSAMATGRTELAGRIYESLEPDMMDDVDRSLIAQSDVIQKQWDDELKLRERDAEQDSLPQVKFTTTRGEFVVELFIEEAPSTVAHFIGLVEDGFYDGLDFFQVIEHMLALTGDPAGDGSTIADQFVEDEHSREVVRAPLRGSLVIAKMPIQGTTDFVPNSAGTQFAILMIPIPSVTRQQTIFGRVIKGMDVVGHLRKVDPHKKKEKNEIVVPPDRILHAEVIRRPESLPAVRYVEQPGGARSSSQQPIPELPPVDLPSL